MTDPLDPYRRQIVRLTRERDEARTECAEVRRAARQAARVNATRLAEGMAPAVEALKIKNARLEEKLMRGKEAAQAANRRAAAAEAELAALRARAAADTTQMRSENEGLRDELAQTRREIERLAADRAEQHVARAVSEREDALRQSGTDEASAVWLLLNHERFFMNACRYLSMTLGQRPEDVISMVLTWATNKDFDRPPKPTHDFLIGHLGVASDGWVAQVLESANTASWKRWGIKPDGAVSLDRAETEGHWRIHELYSPGWYAEYGRSVEPLRPDSVSESRSIQRTVKTAIGHSATGSGRASARRYR